MASSLLSDLRCTGICRSFKKCMGMSQETDPPDIKPVSVNARTSSHSSVHGKYQSNGPTAGLYSNGENSLLDDDEEIKGPELNLGREWREKLMNGIWVKKHYNTVPMLAPRMRVLWLTEDGETLMMTKTVGEEDTSGEGRGIWLGGIQELVVGPTPYSESVKDEALSQRCFSILGDDRVFHIELPSEEVMEATVEGLESFINCAQNDALH